MLGSPRTLPASEVHIGTTGRRVSTLESRILAWELTDRSPVIWKTRESLKSRQHRPCDCPGPHAQNCSSHPGRSQSWALLNRFQAVHRARFERQAAGHPHRSYRPSALSKFSNCPALCRALRRAQARRPVNATDRRLSILTAIERLSVSVVAARLSYCYNGRMRQTLSCSSGLANGRPQELWRPED